MQGDDVRSKTQSVLPEVKKALRRKAFKFLFTPVVALIIIVVLRNLLVVILAPVGNFQATSAFSVLTSVMDILVQVGLLSVLIGTCYAIYYAVLSIG